MQDDDGTPVLSIRLPSVEMRKQLSANVAQEIDEITGKPMTVSRFLTRVVKGRVDGSVVMVNLDGRDQYEALLARVAEDLDDTGRPLTLKRFFKLVVDAYIDGRLKIVSPPPDHLGSFFAQEYPQASS